MQRVGEVEAVFREELERVLGSEALRSAESLRRLLSYLGEAYLQGNGRNLKEYTIGRDVMGKPEDYDPRVDASVRVQIGKLRQRLEQYYRSEAMESAWEIRLPKGHFALALEERVRPAPGLPADPMEARNGSSWKAAAIVLAVACVVLAGWAAWTWRSTQTPAVPGNVWTPAMREFWSPYVDSGRPAMVVLGSPLFVRFHHYYFRNPWVNEWSEVQRTIPLAEMEKLLQSPTPASETHRWTPFGEAMAAFRLARILGPLKENLELKRSTALAWEDVRSNNMIFLGPPKFNPQVHDLPVDQDFVIEQGGVTNRRPSARELGQYKRTSPAEVDEIPEDYVVITRVRGVEGWGEVLVLASSSTEGTWAAADYVTRGQHVADMLARLKAANNGVVPDAYQILLKCSFKSQVPIGVEYVTHHALRKKGS